MTDLAGRLSPLGRDATGYVAGHRGLVGSAVWRHLDRESLTLVLGRASAELDSRDRDAVFGFEEPVNVGVGKDITLRELAELVAGIVGLTGEITWTRRGRTLPAQLARRLPPQGPSGGNPRTRRRTASATPGQWYADDLETARW